MIRVLIADDHPTIRAGLRQLLGTADDIVLVGEATCGEDAVARVAGDAPDVVLMDLSMPGIGGAEAVRQIAATAPGCSVVILTSFSSREEIIASLDAGAVGFLLKDADPGELLAGIRAAARGESPIAPSAAQVLLGERSGPTGGELTSRERQILALLLTGASNRAIAAQLGISAKTVKSHLSSVFRRIGAADRFEAALWARRHGLGGDEP